MPHKHNGTKRKNAPRAAVSVESTYDQVTHRVRKAADEAMATAEAQMEAAQEIASHYVSEGREAMSTAGAAVRDYVRAHPLKALACAAGAGMLLSIFLRRH
jgi:ElaB/YqjD/DUF883 family membrane-anchored ribosome-binding protein